MLSEQSQRKNKLRNRQYDNTRPSHHQSFLSSQLPIYQSQQSSQQQQPSVQSFNHHNNHAINSINEDSMITFDNGWVYQGQHYSNRFHGWGRLIDNKQNQVYKGNFNNGYFHQYGVIQYNPIFQYLININQLKKWLLNKKSISNSNKNSLNQIQVKNPSYMKQNKQIYTFQKYNSSQRQKSILSKGQSLISYENTTVQWLRYQGQFYQGNITGFGTLIIKISTQHSQVSISTQAEEHIVQIVGKFIQGKLITGIIKK